MNSWIKILEIFEDYKMMSNLGLGFSDGISKVMLTRMNAIILFIFGFSLSNAQPINLGCFQWTNSGRQKYTIPSKNDPSNLTPDTCGSWCQYDGFKYAALETGTQCFCGQLTPDHVTNGMDAENCHTPCSGDPQIFCGGVSGDATFLDTSSVNSHGPVQINLKASPDQSSVNGPEIVFDVDVMGNADLTYAFDYGDGTPMTPYDVNGGPNFRKIYRIPGVFLVVIYAKNGNEINQASTKIKINPATNDVSIDCPNEAQANQSITCNLAVNSGGGMWQVDFGDASNEILNANEPSFFTAPSASEFRLIGDSVVPLSSEFQNTGYLYGIEYGNVPATSGPLTFQLACIPLNDQCESCNLYVKHCSATQSLLYCAGNDQCSDHQSISVSTCKNTEPDFEYTPLQDTGSSENNWISFSESAIPVRPACKIVIKAENMADLVYPIDGNKKFWIRPIGIQSSKFALTHSWSIAGTYKIIAKPTGGQEAITVTAEINVKVNPQVIMDAMTNNDIANEIQNEVSEKDMPDALDIVDQVANLANTQQIVPNAIAEDADCVNTSEIQRCDNVTVGSVVFKKAKMQQYLTCVKAKDQCQAQSRSQLANLRTQLLLAMDTQQISNLSEVQTVASTLNAVLSEKDQLNFDGQEKAVSIMNKLTSTFLNSKATGSREFVKQTAQALFENTVRLNLATHYGLKDENEPVLDDQMRIQKMEYANFDTSLPDDPRDIRFVDEMTFPEWALDSSKRHQQKLTAKTAKSIQATLDTIVSKLFQDMSLNDEPIVFQVDGGLMELTYTTVGQLGKSYADPKVNIDFPDFCLISQLPMCNSSTPIQRKIVHYEQNLHSYADRDHQVTTGSLEIVFINPITNKAVPVSNASSPITLRFAQSVDIAAPEQIPILHSYEALKVHRIQATSEPQILHLEVKPELILTDELIAFGVYIRYAGTDGGDQVGTYSDQYDQAYVLTPNQYSFTATLPPISINDDRKEYFYIGIGQLEPNDKPNGTDMGNWQLMGEFTTTYSLSISSHKCHYFAPESLDHIAQWRREGCRATLNSNHKLTECECTHLTIFAAGLIVAPNTIDFAYVFSHGSFAQNISIYVAILVVLIVYTVLLFWSRLKDKEDLELLGCTPMPDNDIHDKYVYEVIVVTGMRKAAATNSKVRMIVVGNMGETDVREFGHPDGPQSIFRRGMTNHFVMTTRRPLGDLNYIRIWHDNTGQGEYASWFLNDLAILDLQTGEKYPFVCNQWLATEKEDGQIIRTIQRASDEELIRFAHVFSMKTKKDLTDGHLWFSVFTRSPGSRFTRVQRLSCCLSVLTTSMLASAMWYGTITATSGGIHLGPFSLGMAEIGVGLMTSLIVFPPNFLIVFLFRRAGPRRKPPSRIETVLKDTMISKAKNPHEHSKVEPPPKKKGPFTLPWWCRGVAWCIWFLVVAASTVFTVFYGIQMKDTSCRKWLMSMIVSFFSSILVTEPVQIFLLAIFVAAVCKKSSTDKDDDWVIDQQDFNGIKYDPDWIQGDDAYAFNRVTPFDHQHLQSKNQDRLKQLRMYDVLRETVIYCFFLWTVFMLVYSSRDTISYVYNRNLRQIFLNSGDKQVDFEKNVHDIPAYWTWTRKVLAPALRASNWYNHEPAVDQLGFLADRTNRILGHATMRQVRSKPGPCPVNGQSYNAPNLAINCTSSLYTDYFNEQKHIFGPNWTVLGEDEKPIRPEYVYRTAESMQHVPTSGQIDYYRGGGYVVNLTGSISELQEHFVQLESEGWIDKFTRAVIIEFSCYDANANLFGVNDILAEFPTTGGVVTSAMFKPIVLLPYQSGFALVQVVFQIVFVLFILIYLIKEIRKMITGGFRKYWKEGWNYLEIMIILLSSAAAIVYIFRYWETQKCLDLFSKTHGNVYISLQYAAALDEAFTGVASFLVFAAVTKLAHLLRFNRRISIMHTTFARCRNYFLNYSVVFGIIFMAFTMAFYMLFQSTFPQYSSFVKSMQTGFTFLLSHGDYLPLARAKPVLGSVFVAMFTVIMTIQLVNIFLTSVMTIFIGVKHDSKQHCEEHEVVNFLAIKTRQLLGLPPMAIQRMAMNDHRKDESLYYTLDKDMATLMRKIDNLCSHIGLEKMNMEVK